MLELPAQTAAEERRVHLDRARREPGQLLGGRHHEVRRLGGHPDLAAVAAVVDGAIQHLHADVREVRQVVGRVDRLRGGPECHVDITRRCLAEDRGAVATAMNSLSRRRP